VAIKVPIPILLIENMISPVFRFAHSEALGRRRHPFHLPKSL
jgi:hypothetical protein